MRALAARVDQAGLDLLEEAAAPPPGVLEGALRRLSAETAEAPSATPHRSSALLPQRSRRVGGDVLPGWVRLRTGLVALAAGLVLVAGLGVLVGRVTGSPVETAVPREPVVVQALVPGVSAQAVLIAHTWGVEVDLGVVGLVNGAAYNVIVLDADGVPVGAGGLIGTGSRRALCVLNAPLLRRSASGFRVMDSAGRPVLAAAFQPTS